MARMDRESLQKVWAPNADVWRAWLDEHHATEPGVWLYMHKKGSGEPSIDWDVAVTEALCYGWIDSVSQRVDDRVRRQYFSPRRPKGTWSRTNKEKVERLIAEGRMMPAGQAAIDRAKANGSWAHLDAVEALIVPEDLQAWFDANPEGHAFFQALSKSRRWAMLYRINSAKRPDTREKRIREITNALAEGLLPDRQQN